MNNSETNSALTGLSPLDGRYFDKVGPLRQLFSEYSLIKFRLKVEVEWFITLANHHLIKELNPLSEDTIVLIRKIISEFSITDAIEIKKIEASTKHDVKAVEYFLKDRLKEIEEISQSLEFIHFGCTSYDINDNCFALMLKSARKDVLLPELGKLTATISDMAQRYADTPMLGRTHGQAAAPTTVGKELRVFAHRLKNQLAHFIELPLYGKFSGAVGNFNSLHVAYSEVDWPQVAQGFVESLGITYSAITTQTESHDYIADYCHTLHRINSILLDLCRDMWSYIAIGYFKQKVVKSEVGSSAMPHKINPIDFENAEGNLGIANALLGHFAERFPISRWQRDLSDSTVLRNLGVPLGHSLIAYQSMSSGLGRVEVNINAIDSDLDQAWEVLAEAIQTVLRKHGRETPYEELKKLTRGVTVSQSTVSSFIIDLNLPEDDRNQLLRLTPATYTGLATELARSNDS